VLTTGAFKQVVVALVPEFEKATGHKVVVDNGTVGQLQKRVDDGEAFDVLVLSPKGIEDYIKSGKIVAGSNANLAKVGVGVMVKEGAPKPDISTVEAFKQALLKAKSVGYIDPASGGSSGIYVAGLLDKLGIAEQIKPKAKLQKGGHVSDLVKAGEARSASTRTARSSDRRASPWSGRCRRTSRTTPPMRSASVRAPSRPRRPRLHQSSDGAVGGGGAEDRGHGRRLTRQVLRVMRFQPK
jgi:hypothetical protein